MNLAESDFKQLLQLRKPIVVAAWKLSRHETFQPIVTVSRGLEEELKHLQNAITIVDGPKKEDHCNDEIEFLRQTRK